MGKHLQAGRYPVQKGKTEDQLTTLDPLALSRHIKQRGAAPVHLWNPPFCGDIDMRIASDGTWYHEGRPIRRSGMVQLFSSVLKREGGNYYLVTPVEKVGIRVDDCPFVAQLLEVSADKQGQVLSFTLNTGEQVVADAEHKLVIGEDPETGEPHPTLHVRNDLFALLSRNAFYELVNLAEHYSEDQVTRTGVRSRQCFFELGRY